jgi:hypothetical protein
LDYSCRQRLSDHRFGDMGGLVYALLFAPLMDCGPLPVSDINTVVLVVRLKALDPEWPTREAI